MDNATIMFFLHIIYFVIRDYDKRTYTRKRIMNELIEKLSCKYPISQYSNDTVCISGELFKIYTEKSWTRYDVKHIGKKEGRENDVQSNC